MKRRAKRKTTRRSTTRKTRKRRARVQVSDILPLSLTLVVAGIGIAFGMNVLSDTKADFVTNTAGCNSTDTSSCGAAYNATGDTITGVAKFSDKMGLIATVIVAAIVIGLLVRFLFLRV